MGTGDGGKSADAAASSEPATVSMSDIEALIANAAAAAVAKLAAARPAAAPAAPADGGLERKLASLALVEQRMKAAELRAEQLQEIEGLKLILFGVSGVGTTADNQARVKARELVAERHVQDAVIMDLETVAEFMLDNSLADDAPLRPGLAGEPGAVTAADAIKRRLQAARTSRTRIVHEVRVLQAGGLSSNFRAFVVAHLTTESKVAFAEASDTQMESAVKFACERRAFFDAAEDRRANAATLESLATQMQQHQQPTGAGADAKADEDSSQLSRRAAGRIKHEQDKQRAAEKRKAKARADREHANKKTRLTGASGSEDNEAPDASTAASASDVVASSSA